VRAERDDRELVLAAQQGERRALEELLARHVDRIHAICRRVIGTARDADDAAQEAMIRIVRGLDGFDGRSAFSTWSHRVATNTALDELRRRSRRPHLQLVRDDATDSPADPVDDDAHRPIDAIADRAAIDEALAELPEDFRLAVVLRDVADLDYAEIATALGVPVGTVKSRIARGRALLVEALGNHRPTERRPTS
jgi:RNA polymerase sigma-70 factor (ECF subfamily)